MKINGACHCGRITYEADVDPHGVVLCHCTDCQEMSGAAYRANIRSDAASFTLKSGSPKTYQKTGHSGHTWQYGFCDHCGTQLYGRGTEDPQTYSLRVGAIIQRQQLMPKHQIWRRSSLAWVDGLAAIPARETE